MKKTTTYKHAKRPTFPTLAEFKAAIARTAAKIKSR